MDILENIEIGIVGTEAVAKKQIQLLQTLGANPHWITKSVVKALPFELDLHKIAQKNCWLVFTSANGVNCFMGQLKEKGIRPEALGAYKTFKYAVIGSATEAALKKYGLAADLCPKTFISEALAIELAKRAYSEDVIYLLRSAIGSKVLPRILKEGGFEVADIAIYALEHELEENESLGQLDYITFASASGVEMFFEQYKAFPKNAKAVCIGPITAKVLKCYVEQFLIAKEITVSGIVETIVENSQKGRNGF